MLKKSLYLSENMLCSWKWFSASQRSGGYSGDEVKRSYCEFEVPKDFNVNNIRFINSNPFGNSMIMDDSFGDTITNMTSFRYNGHFLMSVKLVM